MACSLLVPTQSSSSYGPANHLTLLLFLCGDKDTPLSLYFTISPTYIIFFHCSFYLIYPKYLFLNIVKDVSRTFYYRCINKTDNIVRFPRKCLSVCGINLPNFWWDSLFIFVIFYHLKWYSILLIFIYSFWTGTVFVL